MSRLWPTAETACRVTASRGREASKPSAGMPAAMAPLVTITTRWPAWRSEDTSRQNLATAAPEISPFSSVIDDVPTLATMIIGASPWRRGAHASWVDDRATGTTSRKPSRAHRARSPVPPVVVLVREGEPADADRVAHLRPGPGERTVDAEALQAALGLVQGVVAGQVGQRHRPDRLPALNDPRGTLTDDLVALAHRPMDDELARLGELGPGLPYGVRQPPDQRRHALAGHGRHPQVESDTVGIVLLLVRRAGAVVRRRRRQVGPAAHHDARTAGQLGVVGAQLVHQDLVLLGRRPLGRRRQVEQYAQGPGALDVAQEAVAEALAPAGALDETGDVGHHVLVTVSGTHDAEMRFERGEGVVGDLGLGRRDAADQRRLAHVREADQRDVGEELELEPQPPLLADLALLGEGGCPPPVGQEPGVAAPAPPALGGDEAVAGRHQVGQHLAVAVADDRAHRHLHDDVVAPGAVAALTHAVRAVLGATERLVLERQQRGDVVVGDQDDVAAAPPVAAVGTALGHVGLTAERHRAGAAVAGLDVQVALVDELGHQGEYRGPRSARRTEASSTNAGRPSDAPSVGP